MISENLARELWGTPAAAIGKQRRERPEMPWHEVVGVAQDEPGHSYEMPQRGSGRVDKPNVIALALPSHVSEPFEIASESDIVEQRKRVRLRSGVEHDARDGEGRQFLPDGTGADERPIE